MKRIKELFEIGKGRSYTLVLEMGKSKGEYWLWLRYKTKIIEELCKWGLGKLRINIKEDDK